MKRTISHLSYFGAFAILAILLICVFAAYGKKDDEKMSKETTGYQNLWKKYDSLYQNEMLMQSAHDVADTIYSLAKTENNVGEMVRALVSILQIDASREEDAHIKAVQRIQNELTDAKFPVSSVLNLLLAEYYWQYYQQNRWKFHERTQTGNSSSNDIRTWDLSTLFEKCLESYLKALDNRDLLKKYPLSKCGRLVENAGGQWDKFRPTLFDLIAHRAINFFSSEEPEITRPSYKFELDSEKYFSLYSQFPSVKIVTKDSLSMKYQAMLLFQELISFHKNDNDPAALVDVDLKRLEFVRTYSTVDNKDKLYVDALENLGSKNTNHEVYAEISYYIAQYYASGASNYNQQKMEYRWHYKKANDICTEMIGKYKNSYGAQLCASLKASINEKRFDIFNDAVVVPQRPSKLTVKYRNLNAIYWRMIPVGTEEYEKLVDGRYEYEKIYAKIASLKTLHKEHVKLPDPGDFQEHSVEIRLPVVPVGLYIILASSDESFRFENNILSYVAVRCSQISYFTKNKQNASGTQEYFVRDRDSGTPLSEVKTEVFMQVYNSIKRAYEHVKYGTYKTDKNGYFSLTVPENNQGNSNYRIRFSKGNDELFSDENYLYRNGNSEKHWYTKTFFFTDRAIYRPGQTVYFKGIQISANGDSNRVVSGAESDVIFYDVNGQQIGMIKCVTNQYGTFNGTFTTPLGVLNGSMTISNESGSTQILVEEYKRPKFEVSFKPVEGSYRCGDTISVKGMAKAYSGAPLSGAQVKYQVSRMANFPYWWCWWRMRPSSSQMEIAHGAIMTDDTGGYSVSFKAIPDASIKKSDNPRFTYTVKATVTDLNGETHESSTSVSVAYASVNLSVNISDMVNKQDSAYFEITAKNNSGADVPLKGTIEIYQLQTPEKIIRPRPGYDMKMDTTIMSREKHDTDFPTDLYLDENDWSKWKLKDNVFKFTFNTAENKGIKIENLKNWKQGAYVMKASGVDTYGQDVKDTRYFTLYDDKENTLPYKTADWFVNLTDKAEPGEKARFLVGSSYNAVQALWEIEHDGIISHSEWLTLGNSQKVLEFTIEEKHRGNVFIHYTFIRDNRYYTHTETVNVPWTNKELTIDFETFRDKLQPGEKEEWRLKISGAKKEKVAAEMVVSLYDASLDAFKTHAWDFSIYPYKYPTHEWSSQRCFMVVNGYGHNQVNNYPGIPAREYPELFWEEFNFNYGNHYLSGIGYGGSSVRSSARGLSLKKRGSLKKMPEPSAMMETVKAASASKDGVSAQNVAPEESESDTEKLTKDDDQSKDLSTVKARTNLNETAFFYPELRTDKSGALIVKFTIPEALTKWKMLGFAHTRDLEYGIISKELITQKELMVEPNMPRFFRENDTINFSAKIVNLSDGNLNGNAQLLLFDASTMKPVDSLFKNSNQTQSFDVKKGLSSGLFWRIVIPEGVGPVSCRVVAKAGKFSDGEEKIVPVLPNKMLVTESMPLPVRKKGVKQFSFEKLLSQNGNSTTLRNHKVTLEFTSNPVWYAVQSIPYLIEYPFECAEQTFARYYANSIATNIMNSNPKIKAVFDTWKIESPGALLSALEKNQELKSLLLEETPWLIDGNNESENKKRIGLLFDLNTMNNQLERSLDKLKKMQLNNGGWPWFDGMPDNRYITQHILCGFGRLDKMKIVDCKSDGELFNMVKLAVGYCDDRIREDYEWIKKYGKLDEDNLSQEKIHYLYTRSFFNNIEVEKKNRVSYDYFVKQAEKFWTKNDIYMQGMIACALSRIKKNEIPGKICRSLKERALINEEMGMYWKSMYERGGWFWYQAPIETQALLIEVFDEVAKDSSAVEEMKVWLLKSKQTQNWKTTKATTDAIYALLLRGNDALTEEISTIIQIGTDVIDISKGGTQKTEAGTGYFKKSWSSDQIKAEMGNVKVTRSRDGVAWGSVYWQYFDRLDKITPHETPLSLKRQLFRQIQTDKGTKLQALDSVTTLKIGDKLTVRIELRVDRDMEYVHMKDMRASGLEPVNVLSGYHFQDGLGYYESTRDAATNFFFSYLRKGTYVFEYPLFATHSGEFSNGVTTIQCMYAPEFTSHSEGIRVRIGGN